MINEIKRSLDLCIQMYFTYKNLYFAEFRLTSSETDAFITVSQVSTQHGQVNLH